jgi:hypothetical protein
MLSKCTEQQILKTLRVRGAKQPSNIYKIKVDDVFFRSSREIPAFLRSGDLLYSHKSAYL